MIKTDKPLYEVVNMRMAGWLMTQGFPIIEIRHKERSNVFLFVDSEPLHEAMKKHSEYIRGIREKTNTHKDSDRRNNNGVHEHKELSTKAD